MTSAAAVASTAILPRVAIASPQDPVIDAKPDQKLGGKPVSREKVPWKVVPFPLTQVRLGNGPCTIAMEADRQYLRSLPPDRLLHTSASTLACPPRYSLWAAGRLPTASFAGIMPVVTISPLAP